MKLSSLSRFSQVGGGGGEFELFEFELTEQKWLKSGVKSKGKWTWFELAGSSSYRGAALYL